MIREFIFNSKSELLTQLESDMLAQLNHVLNEEGSASLLLSGGSTPGPVYESLGKQLPAAVQIALVDDRWVDVDHPGSNEALLKRCFPNHAIIGMKTSAQKPQNAVDEVNARYARLRQPYALTLLGMGPDGHTASLFPQAQGLSDALSEDAPICTAITAHRSDVTGDLVDRMTLSLRGILNTRKLILLITGEQKWQVYQAAKMTSNIEKTPVAAVLQQQAVDLDVYWVA